jgi:phosphate transport system substrate-binding protein
LGHQELAVEKQNEPSAQTASPAKRGVSVGRLLVIAVLGAAAAGAIYVAPRFLIKEQTAPTYPSLQLGGTGTVFLIVENRWRTKYREAKGVQITYQSTGSTPAVTNLLDGKHPIGFTHGALSQNQRKLAQEKGRELINLPVILCGVAPVYNVKGLKGKAPLQLTGELLADIFLGKVKTWNDPALKGVNPGVDLPAAPITVVHREDPSGTTRIFTEYLNAVSPAWRETVGPPASAVKWPVGVAAPRNTGVAARVYETEGAIGYVDRVYTAYEEMVLDYAAVQNHDKTAFVRAEPENITAAAAGIVAEVPADLSFNLTNRPGKDAYPLSAVIYAVCDKTPPEATRQQVVEFLHWAMHAGQLYAADMALAPLPAELVKRIDEKLDTMKAAR